MTGTRTVGRETAPERSGAVSRLGAKYRVLGDSGRGACTGGGAVRSKIQEMM
jgi:hypothetical protein